jgi:hypothetical protein
MTDPTAAATDRATCKQLHDLGSAWMLSGETFARGADAGWANPFALYFAGRGGVLGDVDAEVVHAAFGWFNPVVVRALWDEGVAVAGAAAAARAYAEACAAYGRDHLEGFDGAGRFAELAGRVVAGAESSGRPLFAGWKVHPLVDDATGRAMQLVHVMREWRGANHLVGTTAVGLSPIGAVLTADGPGQAKFFGWTEPFEEVTDEDRAALARAEEITDALCAPAFEVLSGPERAEFVELVPALFAAGTAA